ncbi:MAG: hypothetical protein C0483_19960 [Pirellula sp.]|nr:hypothetical protein [Pirellula sp.]
MAFMLRRCSAPLVFAALLMVNAAASAQTLVPPATPAPLVVTPAPAAQAASPLDTATEVEGDPISETLMTTTIAFLNQSYVSIGVLADAAGKDAYTGDELAEMIDLHHSLAEQVEEQLRVLAKTPGLDAEDVAAVNDLAKLAQLNKWQCEALAGVYGGDESKEKIWQQLREAAYTELAKYSDEEETETPAAAATTPTTTPTTTPAAPTTTAAPDKTPTTAGAPTTTKAK